MVTQSSPSPQQATLRVTEQSHAQKGEAPEAAAAAKRELEIKRASAASKGSKVFYKVTVKVCSGVCCNGSPRISMLALLHAARPSLRCLYTHNHSSPAWL